jgi:hypothetical protein
VSTLLANQAIDLAIAAVISAFAVLVTSVAGYVQLRGQQIRTAEKVQGVKDQLAQQGSGGSPTIVTVPPTGAGHMPLAAPAWNQLNDPLPDAQQDPFATTDCGEESVAMAIAACGGPSLPAGVLRQILGAGNPARPGITGPIDLSYLLTLFKLKNHVREADPDSAWIEWGNSYRAGYLVIALGYWVTPGFRHWVLIRQTDSGAVVFNDPWGGLQRTMTRDQAQRLYCGVYIHIDQAVSAPAPAPPS